MKEQGVSRLTLDLPADLHRQLKVLAAQRGLSMKAMIMQWIEHGLTETANQKRPRP